MSDDYGFYGKGLDGYVHYTQSVDEISKVIAEAGQKAFGERKRQPYCRNCDNNPHNIYNLPIVRRELDDIYAGRKTVHKAIQNDPLCNYRDVHMQLICS